MNFPCSEGGGNTSEVTDCNVIDWNTWSGDRDHDCKPSRTDSHPYPCGSAVVYPPRWGNNMLPMQQRIRSKMWRSIRPVQSWNGELQFSTTSRTFEPFGTNFVSKNQPKSVRQDQGCQRLRIHYGRKRQWHVLEEIRYSRCSGTLLLMHRWSMQLGWKPHAVLLTAVNIIVDGRPGSAECAPFVSVRNIHLYLAAFLHSLNSSVTSGEHLTPKPNQRFNRDRSNLIQLGLFRFPPSLSKFLSNV